MIVPFQEVADAEVTYIPEVSTQEKDMIVSFQEVGDAEVNKYLKSEPRKRI
jgi:hypothetical protein